ncbi:IS3 family transposase [Streptomyces sp. NBC_00286]|uniref:IS3 family transposase n=1 Tax=Streptomyces sp. NBC_00286 TaxID=2975701 RepID=UPI002E2D0105|nr:IS3 family transposase [Streptomyces sp. NBC_00286]
MIVKAESIPGRAFTTQVEATLALFEYIDGFYNSRRIQKRLGYLSPIEFEEKHYADPATAERTNLKPHHPALTSSSAPPARRGNLKLDSPHARTRSRCHAANAPPWHRPAHQSRRTLAFRSRERF